MPTTCGRMGRSVALGGVSWLRPRACIGSAAPTGHLPATERADRGLPGDRPGETEPVHAAATSKAAEITSASHKTAFDALATRSTAVPLQVMRRAARGNGNTSISTATYEAQMPSPGPANLGRCLERPLC
jgi:hypothetical protein